MHEMSIAIDLVEVACAQAERLGAVRVQALHVRVGRLSGVVKEALAFSFDMAAQGSTVEGARLEIQDVPVTVHCPRCEQDRELPGIQHFRCPQCGTPTAEIVAGRDIQLTALEVIDDGAAAHR